MTNLNVKTFSTDLAGDLTSVTTIDNKEYTIQQEDPPVLQDNKAVTLSESGEVTPSTGYDAMKKVTVTLDVPSPPLEDNKTFSITSNGSSEITPSATYDAMKKVTVTVNVSTSVTPPSWYTDGVNSVVPNETTVAMANLSQQEPYQTQNIYGDGTKTIAELIQGQLTVDTLLWIWNSNGVLILGYTQS